MVLLGQRPREEWLSSNRKVTSRTEVGGDVVHLVGQRRLILPCIASEEWVCYQQLRHFQVGI